MRIRPTRLLLPCGAVAYAGLSAASAFLINARTDLDISFWPSALEAAHGHPLLVYSVAGHSAYPNANGPLALLPLSLVALIASRTGLEANTHAYTAIALAAFSVFSMLLAREAMLLVDEIAPWRKRMRPWVLAATILLAPPLWLATTGFGHLEMPVELWLVALSARQWLLNRPTRTGIALGLAVLARSSAALYLIPLLIVNRGSERLRNTILLTGVGVSVVVIGVAPFYVADSSNVVHSLLTYRSDLPIGGGSFWYLLRDSAAAVVAQRFDVVVVAALGAAVCALLRAAVLRSTRVPQLVPMLFLSACSFPLLAKTSLLYYLLEPYVFAVMWWSTARSLLTPRLIAPLVLLGATLLADFGVDLPRVISLPVQSVLLSVMLATSVAAVFVVSRIDSVRSAAAGSGHASARIGGGAATVA